MEFIVLHSVDGRDIHVNPPMIVTISEAREPGDPHKQLTGPVSCVVTLVDGKFVTVIETCETVRRRLKEKGRP